MVGWTKLHRDIQQHYLWNDKPFAKGQAWTDLILMANHKDNKFILGNELVEVERGSFITSEVKLMDRWGWSKSKVRAFLKLLESDSMIVKKADRKKTTLKIVNYDFWQDSQTTEEPQKNHQETTKELQKDTNKNVKNVKNVKNDNNKKNIPAKKKKEIKQKYGEYKKVKFTDEQFEKLKATYTNYQELITFLDEYIEMKGKYKVENHLLAINRWVVDAVEEKKKKKQGGYKKQMDNTNNASFRDFEEPKTFDMEEFIKEKGIK